ncbi:hypothetical protein SAMN02799641_05734 [Rhodococcus erythropolis]|uniref:hypothetical protein n=1 Tax=Rhodococcus erythropolis TaxID=1833 RepID=UPI00087617CA|nr:hypothetical protein [Rhodococcus erythropolis]SCZ14090.1 hypothetical protein SAMN02799641_05734 [Rhodococcus erythropolis]
MSALHARNHVEGWCADAQANINACGKAAKLGNDDVGAQLFAQVAQAQALLALVGAVSRLADRLPKVDES